MQIEEFYEFTVLYDLYGNLLSNKQREVMDKFLNLDLGESELAELLGESRQAIHDAIIKAKKQLILFEEKCGLLKIHSDAKHKLENVKTFLQSTNESQNKIIDIIDDVINSL